MSEHLLVGTRKGAWKLSSPDRVRWTRGEPWFFGRTVHHLVEDPRDGETLLASVRTGHLGPTVFRSTDAGATWTESERPPRFRQVDGGRSVHHVFWLAPGRPEEPGRWYAGTSPQGLFVSDDGGVTWDEVAGLHDDPRFIGWIGGDKDGTPDGPKLHSILVDPRDGRHLYFGMSSGGSFESTDGGASWSPMNENVYIDYGPDHYPEFGQDPHCMVLHPANPDRLYQQNHCGIYRLDRPGTRWERIGDNMPRDVGDIGFPLVPHPRDPDTVWVWPMDGTDVWPRTAPGGRPALYRTQDGGATWERQDRGLPASGFFSVKRQCLVADTHDPVGLYFGTSGGEVYGSVDEGDSWSLLTQHLPHVYAVEWCGQVP